MATARVTVDMPEMMLNMVIDESLLVLSGYYVRGCSLRRERGRRPLFCEGDPRGAVLLDHRSAVADTAFKRQKSRRVAGL